MKEKNNQGDKKIRVIIAGASGMVGRGALLHCLEDERVEKVLMVNRRPLDAPPNPKLHEVLLHDFFNPEVIKEKVRGYDLCFYSIGVSSVNKSQEEYSHLTYDLTMGFAKVLLSQNPAMVFEYVSAAGADSSERGRVMWARVRGGLENALLRMAFREVYVFRPGMIIPEGGVRSATPLYNALYTILKPFYGIFRKMDSVTTTARIGEAMVNCLFFPCQEKILSNAKINRLAALSSQEDS